MKYKIVNGSVVVGLASERRVLRAGTIIESGDLPAEVLQRLERKHVVIPLGLPRDEAQARDDARNEKPILPIGGTAGDEDGKPLKQAPRLTKVSQWALDPDMLRSKSVEVLNVMIRERDASIEPFETQEEAIAQLSRDFVEA